MYAHEYNSLWAEVGDEYVGNQLVLARVSRVARIGTRAARFGRITRAFESWRQLGENRNRSKKKMQGSSGRLDESNRSGSSRSHGLKRMDSTTVEAENNRWTEIYVLVSGGKGCALAT